MARRAKRGARKTVKGRMRRRVRRTKRSQSRVTIESPERPLAYKDAIFRIHVHGEKLGEFRVSQGGLDWYPRDAKKRRRFGWARLARVLDGGR